MTKTKTTPPKLIDLQTARHQTEPPISLSTLRSWIYSGQLAALRVGRKVYLRPADWDAWLAGGKLEDRSRTEAGQKPDRSRTEAGQKPDRSRTEAGQTIALARLSTHGRSMTSEREVLLSLRAAAERYAIGYSTLRRLVRDGTLPARRWRGRWRVRPADIEALCAPTPPPRPAGR
jgi:excisionase family DNA binding protein